MSDRPFFQYLEGLQAAAHPAFSDRQYIGVITRGHESRVEGSQSECCSAFQAFPNDDVVVALWRRLEWITLVQSSVILHIIRPRAGTLVLFIESCA